MAVIKTFIGNIKGDKGDTGEKGDTGAKGDKGDTGAKGDTGTRGSRWNTGTAITGTSTTATVFSTGITDSLVNDMYLNTSTGNTYRCTVAGNASTAKWVYTGNIKGPQGAYATVDSAFNSSSTNPVQNKIVTAELEKKLASSDDTQNNIVTFTSADETNPTAWKDVAALASKEKHSSLLNKISTMFSNVRYLYKILGTTDISALGTVTQAIATLNGNVGSIKGISSSAAITTQGQYALDAREKNASVEGTLANQLSVINSNLIKVYISSSLTSEISGNSDGNITFNCPQTYSEILGCIPFCLAVSQTWETYAVVSGVYLNDKLITIHTFGSITQKYSIAYAVLYR